MAEFLRTLQLLGAVLVVGGPAFLALIWRRSLGVLADPGQRELLEARVSRRVRWALVAGALLLSAGATAELLRLAVRLSDGGLLGAESFAIAGQLVRTTGTGRYTLVRLPLAAGILACLPWRRSTPLRSSLLWPLGAGLLATFGLTGHAMTGSGSPMGPLLADLIHMTATALWYGGLLLFALLPWRSLGGSPVLGAAVRRFSALGVFSVIALAGTGLFMSSLRLYGPLALVEHPYGVTLFIKLGFLAGVLALAAVNHGWVTPRIQLTGADRIGVVLRWLVSGEALLGLAVVVAAAVLSTTAPPQGEPLRLQITLTGTAVAPAILEIPAHRPVRLTIINADETDGGYIIQRFPHEILTGGHQHGGDQEMHLMVSPGQREIITFIARRPGEYPIYVMRPNETVLSGAFHVK